MSQLTHSPHLRDILRTLNISRGGITVPDLAQELAIPEASIAQALELLSCESLVERLGQSSRWSIIPGATVQQRLAELLRQLDAQAITESSRNSKIDVVGRLAWIEDAAEMIRYARESYLKQAKSRPE